MDGLLAKILNMISSLIASTLTLIFNLSTKADIYINEWKLSN